MRLAVEKWVGIARPFPRGRIARLVLLIIILGFVALDTAGGEFDLARTQDWFRLVLPWTPLFAFLIGPRTAVVIWFLMFAVILVSGAAPVRVSGTALPTMILVALCGFVLVWRASVIFTSGVIVMLALAVVVNPTQLSVGGVVSFATLVVLATAAGLGLNLLRTRLERSARRVEELRAQQARVRAEERTRLAYELHDIVAHEVTLIAMQARRAEFAGPERTGQILESIGDAAAQALQDLRSLVLLLKREAEEDPRSADDLDDEALMLPAQDPAMPPETAPTTGGLVEDIREVAAELEQAGFAVQLEVEGPADDAATSLRQMLRRTLRELGTNILKHGDPSGPVALRMVFTSDDVTLSASNRISASTPIMSSGTGLEAMRARCEIFGGRLVAAAEDDRWATSISFPSIRPLAPTPPEIPS